MCETAPRGGATNTAPRDLISPGADPDVHSSRLVRAGRHAAPTIPLFVLPAPLGGPAAELRGKTLSLDPTATRDELLVAIEEAAVFLRTGDPGSATVSE